MLLGNEEKEIYVIVDDILQLEDKIEGITSKRLNEPNEKQLQELAALRQDQAQNETVISSIQSNLAETLDENKENIKRKEADIAKLNRTITEIERQLRNLAVTSVTTSPSNSLHLTYEKLELLLSSRKSTDELKQLEQDYAIYESSRVSIEESIKDKENRQRELNENLRMMKEEKTMINCDLVNLISQKESLEEMAKLKLQTMKTGEKVPSLSLPNARYSIKAMELYRYELSLIDLNKLSKEISEAVIDSNEDIVTRTYLLNMIKNEAIDYMRHSAWQKNSNDFLSAITAKSINILQAVPSIKELSEEHLTAYYKALFKVSYYEKIIAAKIAFVSKEYKTMKKEINEEVGRIQAEVAKLEAKKEETEAKVKELRHRMNVLVDSRGKDGIGPSKEEKDFLQLSDKINYLNALKDEIVYEIDQLVNSNESLQLDANNKVKQLTKANDAITKRINAIDKEVKDCYLKSNDDIVYLRQLIADKFRVIKTQLKIYKEQYGNNLDLYNRLVENINSTLRMSSILKPSYSSLIINYEEVDAENTNRQLMSSFRQKNLLKSSQTQRSEKSKSVIYQHQFSKTPQKSYREHHSYYKKQLRTPEGNDHYFDMVNYDNNNNCVSPSIVKENTLKTPYKKTLHSNSSISPTRNKGLLNSSRRPINNNLFNNIQNSTSIAWEEDKRKLEKTIQKLKSSISKSESIIDKEVIVDKLKPIFKTTFCYYRLMGSNCNWESKFNPLENSVNERLFGFAKANISLSSKLSSISVKQANGIGKEIAVDEIESTIVTNVMKYIIKIFRNYRRSQGKKMAIEDFIKKEEFNDIPLSFNDRIKAAVNQLFNMTLKLSHDLRIEFVFLSYEDFKLWLNGLAFLIKNKTEVFKYRTMTKK